MRVAGWRTKELGEGISYKAIETVNGIMDDVALQARILCPWGEVTREGKWKIAQISFTPKTRLRKKIPEHLQKAVSFQAQVWSGRFPGQLMLTIRRVNKHDRPGNVRVYAGNKKVNYAHFVEYGTSKMERKSFMRPSFNAIKKTIKSKLEKGLSLYIHDVKLD